MTSEPNSRLKTLLASDAERVARRNAEDQAAADQADLDARENRRRTALWIDTAVPAIEKAVLEANALLAEGGRSTIAIEVSGHQVKRVSLTSKTRGRIEQLQAQVMPRDTRVFMQITRVLRIERKATQDEARKYPLEQFDAMELVTDFVAACIDAEK